MTMLSSSYGIIMDCAINAPGSVDDVVDRLNATGKHFLRGEMGIIGKLASNDTSKIGMLPSASKDLSVKFAYQCIHILNSKEIINGLKGITKV